MPIVKDKLEVCPSANFLGELDATTDKSLAAEQVMIERLFDKAVGFYKNPKNLQAFKAWQKNKEELKYGTNHINP